jgi:hypothetical protein
VSAVIALIGAKALYLMYAWLASAIAGAWLSNRKGYGEKPGLATGLLLSALGPLIWLVWPAKADSPWKILGPFPWSGGDKTVAEVLLEKEHQDDDSSADSAESTSA